MITFVKSKISSMLTGETEVHFSLQNTTPPNGFAVVARADGIELKGTIKIMDQTEMQELAKTMGLASQEWIKLRNAIRNKLSV